MSMCVAVLLFSLMCNYMNTAQCIHFVDECLMNVYSHSFVVAINNISVTLLVLVIWCSCARVSAGNYPGLDGYILGYIYGAG